MIKYVKGDATKPEGEGIKIIVHIVNDLGAWGNGFVVAVSKRWKSPEASYREWHKNREQNDFASGSVQFVQVEPEIYVANMVAQHGLSIYVKNGYMDDLEPQVPPIRYDALRDCLKKVCVIAKKYNASVVGPRFGSGLAGGSWEIVEQIINEELINQGVEVVIYDLEKKTPFGRK
jgi:O-acetyl-ADP-ribose deacetylase (regulator of RNase III)